MLRASSTGWTAAPTPRSATAGSSTVCPAASPSGTRWAAWWTSATSTGAAASGMAGRSPAKTARASRSAAPAGPPPSAARPSPPCGGFSPDTDKDTEMTYLKDGFEYLTDDELKIVYAIDQLRRENRTGNNSQIASYSHLNRTAVGWLTEALSARGFIKDTGKGNAHHWQTTDQPVPY